MLPALRLSGQAAGVKVILMRFCVVQKNKQASKSKYLTNKQINNVTRTRDVTLALTDVCPNPLS